MIQYTSEVEDTSVAYKPMFQIDDLPISQTVKDNLKKKGITQLTPIQDQVIPAVHVGQDIVGIAETGSGKTAAFLIPVIEKILKDPTKKSLIVTPTRELAMQINNELRSLATNLDVFSVVCVGGVDIKNQIFFLRKKHNVVIGTPGRLLDLIEKRIVNLKDFKILVLDEVDRMLDMGFIDDVSKIISEMPTNRQTMFLSATVSKNIEKLMKRFLTVDYARFSVKPSNTKLNIQQRVVPVSQGQHKQDILEKILGREDVEKAIIFVKTKRYVDILTDHLKEKGFKASALHGDKSMYHRKKNLDLFRQGKVDILVATDIASRGLDIPSVSHVINYDVPDRLEDYTHRIGRTGRANKKGYAVTLVPASMLKSKDLAYIENAKGLNEIVDA
jgi:superfamily II DNA/RNA helicase